MRNIGEADTIFRVREGGKESAKLKQPSERELEKLYQKLKTASGVEKLSIRTK